MPNPRSRSGLTTGSACDQCFRCKVRCSGETPSCERCRKSSTPCTYSTGKPLGKPKGSKNRTQAAAGDSKRDRSGSIASTMPASHERTLSQSSLSHGLHTGAGLPSPAQTDTFVNPFEIAANHKLASQTPRQTPTTSGHNSVHALPILSPVSVNPISQGPNRSQSNKLSIMTYSDSTRGSDFTHNETFDVPFKLHPHMTSGEEMLLPTGLGFDESFLCVDEPVMAPNNIVSNGHLPFNSSVCPSRPGSTATNTTTTTCVSPTSLGPSPLDILSSPRSARIIGLILERSSSDSDLPIDSHLVGAQEALHLIQSCLKCSDFHSSAPTSWHITSLLICCQLLQGVACVYTRLLRQLSTGEATETSGTPLHLGDFMMSPELHRNVLEMIVKRGLSDCRAALGSLEACHKNAVCHGAEKESQLVMPYFKVLSASLSFGNRNGSQPYVVDDEPASDHEMQVDDRWSKGSR